MFSKGADLHIGVFLLVRVVAVAPAFLTGKPGRIVAARFSDFLELSQLAVTRSRSISDIFTACDI